MKVIIRWLTRRDMPRIAEIERASLDHPWTEDDFVCCFRQRPSIGLGACCNTKLVGFLIYELHRSILRILDIAVAPSERRQAVATQLVRRLIGKLQQQHRSTIVVEVRETNLSAQQFFRSQGFCAFSMLPDHYDDTWEDAVAMSYRLPVEVAT